MSVILHGALNTRAAIVRWYLEEKDIPYTWRTLAMKQGEHRQAPFTDLNPFGKVPVLVDETLAGPDGKPLVVFESGAILLHLADRYGQEFDGPGDRASALRALTAQWVLFANATLSPTLFRAESDPQELDRLMTVLDGRLAAGGSLLGGPWGEPAWGAADCAVQAHLAYVPLFLPQLDLAPWPHIQAQIAATTARPAYLRAMGGE